MVLWNSGKALIIEETMFKLWVAVSSGSGQTLAMGIHVPCTIGTYCSVYSIVPVLHCCTVLNYNVHIALNSISHYTALPWTFAVCSILSCTSHSYTILFIELNYTAAYCRAGSVNLVHTLIWYSLLFVHHAKCLIQHFWYFAGVKYCFQGQGWHSTCKIPHTGDKESLGQCG